jgi:hypothetical protein
MIAGGTAEEALRRELEPGERLYWTGMPSQGIQFRSGDLFLVPFSLMWGGMAFFAAYSTIFVKKAPLATVLWTIPFVLIGAYLIAGRFFVDSYQRSRTYYGLTDRRAIILSGLWSREAKTIYLQNLNEITLSEAGDGRGTIVFGRENPYYSGRYGSSWPGMSKSAAPAFEMIPDVRRVYELIKQTRAKANL